MSVNNEDANFLYKPQFDYGPLPEDIDANVGDIQESNNDDKTVENEDDKQPRQPWGWNLRHRQRSPAQSWYRLRSPTIPVLPPDRLLSSHEMGENVTDNTLHRSKVRLSPKLPNWMWVILMSALGIGKPDKKSRLYIGTVVHLSTLVSASLYGVCGLYFNIYDVMSDYTKTTVLLGIAKSVLGIYIIGLGVYSNSLAARLFSNQHMVDCIRLHSKTFMKVSTTVIVCILCVIVVVSNLYTNRYLLDTYINSTVVIVEDANCASIGIEIALCDIYFVSKVIYCVFCLAWNLLVVGLYLSVCRTHTIGIRKFMKELAYDTKIFEEFCRLKALEQTRNFENSVIKENLSTSETEFIWNDDINTFVSEAESGTLSIRRLSLLRSLRSARLQSQKTIARSSSDPVNSECLNADSQNYSQAAGNSGLFYESENAYESSDQTGRFSQKTENTQDTTIEIPKEDFTQLPGSSATGQEVNFESGNSETSVPFTGLSSTPRRLLSNLFTCDGKPPIMGNEDLLFTYFSLLRRLASTSRLLQRWISSWITFVFLWCALFISYWTSHTASLEGIVQFLLPLVILGLLTSAYAEVNFEGERLLKCILPTEDRMSVIYYFQSCRLELKIFSFTMTYNSIITVVAGIAVTFATRIILDQFSN